jgi:hypothetical protein
MGRYCALPSAAHFTAAQWSRVAWWEPTATPERLIEAGIARKPPQQSGRALMAPPGDQRALMVWKSPSRIAMPMACPDWLRANAEEKPPV